jgi:hypothetical protein
VAVMVSGPGLDLRGAKAAPTRTNPLTVRPECAAFDPLADSQRRETQWSYELVASSGKQPAAVAGV